MAICKPGRELWPRTKLASALILDFPVSTTVGKLINSCCLSCSVYGILLRSPRRPLHVVYKRLTLCKDLPVQAAEVRPEQLTNVSSPISLSKRWAIIFASFKSVHLQTRWNERLHRVTGKSQPLKRFKVWPIPIDL